LNPYQTIVADIFAINDRATIESTLNNFRAKIQSENENPHFLFTLGICNVLLNRYELALIRFAESKKLDPKNWVADKWSGYSLMQLGKPILAIEKFQKTLEQNPNNLEVLFWLGKSYFEIRQYKESERIFLKIIEKNSSHYDALNALGVVLRYQNRLDEAIEYCSQAITLKPNLALAFYNRANAYKDQLMLDSAEQDYLKAIELDPSNAEAKLALGILYLLQGKFEEGWPLYEWRKQIASYPKTHKISNVPLLTSINSATGKQVLIDYEQGYGDLIQCCRYIPLLIEQGVKVTLNAPEPLLGLMETLDPRLRVITKRQDAGDIDFFCSVMSLPLLFNTTLETIPNQIPYLFARELDEQSSSVVNHEKLPIKIGLAWSGSKTHDNNHNRSISLLELEPLLSLDFEFHSLQKEYTNQDRHQLALINNLVDHHEELLDFEDTARLISKMDLVISVDTSVAHLAGALGQSVCVLLPYMPDFRWMLELDTSPWYPSAKLFRQPALNDWKTVIHQLKNYLCDIS
jgi:tetratricopeptide (TPR) repeat protein